eukprot:7821469-Heterocapsa_arctica.AAC.1
MACMMSSGRERQQQQTRLNSHFARWPPIGGGSGVEHFSSNSLPLRYRLSPSGSTPRTRSARGIPTGSKRGATTSEQPSPSGFPQSRAHIDVCACAKEPFSSGFFRRPS